MFGVCTALAEEPSFVPNTYTKRLTTAYMSHSRQTSKGTCTWIHIPHPHPHLHKIINNSLRLDLYYIVCKARGLKREHRPTRWKHLVQGLLAEESKLEPEIRHRKARMPVEKGVWKNVSSPKGYNTHCMTSKTLKCLDKLLASLKSEPEDKVQQQITCPAHEGLSLSSSTKTVTQKPSIQKPYFQDFSPRMCQKNRQKCVYHSTVSDVNATKEMVNTENMAWALRTIPFLIH